MIIISMLPLYNIVFDTIASVVVCVDFLGTHMASLVLFFKTGCDKEWDAERAEILEKRRREEALQKEHKEEEKRRHVAVYREEREKKLERVR